MTKTLTLTQTECDLLEDILLYAVQHFEADDVAAGERFRQALLGVLQRINPQPDERDKDDVLLDWLREMTPTVTH